MIITLASETGPHILSTTRFWHFPEYTTVTMVGNTGYKGRLGIHELLMNTAAIKRMIRAGNNLTEMTIVAVSEGMAMLWPDGMNKILLGLTDWEQIRTI